MELDYSRKEKIVGAFIIVIAALFFAAIVSIGRGQGWFKKYITFYTTFNEGYNLQTNASVKLFKTEIGKVKDIALVENKVRVKLAIIEEYKSRIRGDALASVESPTLIGDEYVSIKPGTKKSAPIDPGGEIKSVERKSLSDYLQEFELEKTSRMFVKAVQELSETIHIMHDPKGPVFTALKNTNSIIAGLEAGKGSLGKMLKSKEMFDNINQKLDQIGSILSHIDSASARAPKTMKLVNQNLENIGKVSKDISEGTDNIQSIMQGIEESVENLKAALAKMEKGSRDVPEITRTARKGIREIRAGVKRVDKVFSAMEQNVLIRSSIPHGPEAENTDAGLRP